jgi:cytidylate kinase
MTPNAAAARRLIVAIDGPSGAGKGTVARALAARLNYCHIDTGAMYRAVAWKAVHEKLDLQDEDALARLAERAEIDVSDGLVRVDGHDVRQAIRTPEIDTAAAAVARQPRVREVLISQQREMGARGGVVMEGRDIGTVVFPKAEVKIYLDATPDERARRRAHDPAHSAGKGTGPVQNVNVASALAARDNSDPVHIVGWARGARDNRDRTRAASPLAVAADAVVIDTTGLPIDEVVNRVMALVQQRGQ